MYLSYLIAAAVAVAWYVNRGEGSGAAVLRRRGFRSPLWIWLPAAALIVTFIAQIGIDRTYAATGRHVGSGYVSYPIAIVADGTQSVVGDVVAGLLAVIQSALLAVLAAAMSVRRKRCDAPVVAAASVVTVILALWAPVATSADFYAYVGTAVAAGSPYHPAAQPFSGEHAVINVLWGLPVIASPYGPLWSAIAKFLLLPLHSLGAQLFSLRCLGAAAFAGCVIVLFVLRVPRAAIAAFALNPALIAQYVMDAHNDGLGLLLVLAALAAARVPIVAALLVTAAGCIKLPFLALGAVAFRSRPRCSERIGLMGFAIVIAAGWYAACVGANFLSVMGGASRVYAAADGAALAAHVAAAAVALVALAGALLLRRFCGGASWSFSALAVTPVPWYLGWGLPYALCSGAAVPFLISLPLAADLTSQTFAPTMLTLGLALIITLSAFCAIARKALPLATSLVACGKRLPSRP
ncbi:MAG: hypothetical protein GIX01_06985 [Candidatus Eremiobacteraeota bacterium]|nr:hypothetical protein [Candidatus Eremiobacteraeota bacterium]